MPDNYPAPNVLNSAPYIYEDGYRASYGLARTSYGLAPLTEADLYMEFISENKLLTEVDIYKVSSLVNIFCEAVLYNRFG